MGSTASKHDAEKLKIYTPDQVFAASFFGGIAATIYTLKKNFEVLGDDNAAEQTLIWGTFFLVLVTIGGYFLPEGTGFVVSIAYSYAARNFAVSRQIKREDIIVSDRYIRHSAKNMISVCLIGFITTIVMATIIITPTMMIMHHFCLNGLCNPPKGH